MIASLAPCFTGTLARFDDAVALPGEHGGCLDGAALLDGETAEALVRRFEATRPGGDRRAIVSLWTQWHFGAVIIPAAAAIVRMGRVLPVGLGEIGVAVREDGRTECIVIAHDGDTAQRAPSDEAAEDRFEPLFRDHVGPLIESFANWFKVSRRLLWSNAATTFEWTLRQAEPGGCTRALAEGRARLETPFDHAGRPRPMFGALRHCEQGEGAAVLKRRVCCLRYAIPGVPDCASLCPLPPNRR